jgi:glycosyltransferase involved in cell wall biosynthesis
MKSVFIYVADDIDVILEKSNAWYIRHYEAYFDRVYMIYLRGRRREPITQGRTSLVALGAGNSKLDFLLAPFRLYRLAREVRPTAYVTWDQIWSWWISWAVQLLLGARVYLMPQFMPEQIYGSSGRSVSMIFPVWLERRLIRLSFLLSHRALTGRCFGNYAEWLRSWRPTRHKTVVVDTLPEALPPPAFLERLEQLEGERAGGDGGVRGSGAVSGRASASLELIYVGRLQRQKLVDNLIRMMHEIGRGGDWPSVSVKLTLVGDGPDRDALESLAAELGVSDAVGFAGQVRNEELPRLLLRSDVYVSPLTGMSLREAALCGLPVVAYDMDWLRGFLRHEETALLVPPGDYEALAREVVRLAGDAELRGRLGRNIGELARRVWSPRGLRENLRQIFEGEARI